MKSSFLLVVFLPLSLPAFTAVTYTFSGGRLGDNLLAYCHAKWIAYQYNIPLLYKPFAYSDQLMMDTLEIPYSPDLEPYFKKIVTYCEADGHIDPASNYLYVIPFFCESVFNREDLWFPFLFYVDWHDVGFKQELQRMICPIQELPAMDLPPGVITVALHVRKGTGWDIPVYKITPKQLTASHPLRFAPDSFYAAQLKKIIQMYPDSHFYVHLFTDHNDPEQLIELYKNALDCDQITFGYRAQENNEFVHVLEDFFALTHFDCLVRPDSNFSIVASKLGNYKVLISPWHGIVKDEETVIDEINIEIDGKSSIVKELS
jgi:hypothetical protein